MFRQAALAVLLAGLTLTGCQSRHQDNADVGSIKQAFSRVNPDVQVGTISVILPEQNLLAITDLPLDQFAIGDTLVFMNRDQKIIAAGHVVRKTADALHVSYSTNELGIKPAVGDIAVKPTK